MKNIKNKEKHNEIHKRKNKKPQKCARSLRVTADNLAAFKVKLLAISSVTKIDIPLERNHFKEPFLPLKDK